MTARDEAAIAPLRNADTFRLGSGITQRGWQRPADTEMRDGAIEWGVSGKQIWTKPDSAMLERFLSLGDATDAAILRFAKRYGVLALCDHGAPSSHSPQCRPVGWPGPCREALVDWRFFSRSVLATLKISAALTLGKTPAPADWQVIYSRSGRTAPWWKQSVDADKSAAEDVLNEWLSYAMPRFEVRWDGVSPELEMKPGAGMFGSIALQLVLRAGRKDSMAVCFHCGAAYTAQRRPKAGQRNFCPECRRNGIPQQYAHDDFRKKGR